MSNMKNIRRLFVCLAAVCLSVLFLAGCGAPEGQEDYEKGLAAYETGDYTTAIAHFTTAAALEKSGAEKVLVAAEETLDALVAAVVANLAIL